MSFAEGKKIAILTHLEVIRKEQISPNFMRVTLGGDDVARIPARGFDHWGRLFLPQEDGETSFDLPDKQDLLGYLKYLRIPGPHRPHLRNYTIRAVRHDVNEVDIDFVVHGDEGVATRWVRRVEPGGKVAYLDQGCGFDLEDWADEFLIATDETGLPAAVGILAGLPRDARGAAFIELPDEADKQEVDAPAGVQVNWLIRTGSEPIGSLALAAGQTWTPTSEMLSAYLVGESSLATGMRRHLVNEHKVPKKQIVFTGYWKQGTAH